MKNFGMSMYILGVPILFGVCLGFLFHPAVYGLISLVIMEVSSLSLFTILTGIEQRNGTEYSIEL